MKIKSLASILTLSMLSGLLSIIVIVIFPVNVTLSKNVPATGPSPYMLELQALHSKASKGLHPDAWEWSRMEELRIKNEKWFDDNLREAHDIETITTRNVVKNKSSKLALLLMLFWAVSYYLIARVFTYHVLLFILSLPLALLAVQLYSFTAWTFSTLGVSIVYFVLVAKNRNRLGDA